MALTSVSIVRIISWIALASLLGACACRPASESLEPRASAPAIAPAESEAARARLREDCAAFTAVLHEYTPDLEEAMTVEDTDSPDRLDEAVGAARAAMQALALPDPRVDRLRRDYLAHLDRLVEVPRALGSARDEASMRRAFEALEEIGRLHRAFVDAVASLCGPTTPR